MSDKLTVAEWAAKLGISRQQGYEAIKRCEIPVVDGKVDEEFATLLYRRHTRPRANAKRTEDAPADPVSAGQDAPGGAGESGSAPAASAVPSYEKSRARREAAEAQIAEMKEAEMRGRMLPRAEVEAAVFKISRALRDGLMNCSRRLAADVAPLTSAEECEEIIEREHRALLASMAHQFRVDVLPPAAEGEDA